MRIGDKVVCLSDGILGEVVRIEEGPLWESPLTITAQTLMGELSGARVAFQYANADETD